MIVCGLDASTSTVGWSFQENNIVLDAGFLNISKIDVNKNKGKMVVDFLSNHNLIKSTHHINLEAALSGFGGGKTSQQTIIMLSRWNAILEYMLFETLNLPVVLCNVNTMRKKVLGKARVTGMKPKEYVKSRIELVVPNIKQFEKLNRNEDWDVHNSDMYDACICSLYG